MDGGSGEEPGTTAGASGHMDEGGAADAAQAGAEAPATPSAGSSSAGGTDGGGQAAPTGTEGHDMSDFEADVEDSELTGAMARIGQLGDDLARAKADLFNLNQQYGNYVRRAKEAASAHRESGHEEVVESLIGVLDDIDAARTHGELEGPFASIAQKLEDTLSTRFHLERFGAVGDDFDPTLHEALMARTSAEVDHPVVAQVLQPGYRMEGKVLRPTKVLVENPE